MGSEQEDGERSKRRWSGCLSLRWCFQKGKGGGKRIVPASRILQAQDEVTRSSTTPQTVSAIHSLVAPPSSPASFTHSPLPSTAHSPTCFFTHSPAAGPSSTMFATGPYAHETNLVSPPVFSTFTTEPSTAPLTPPPEHAHLTTPSSPDVPFASFLSDSNFFCPATFAQFYLDNPPFPHTAGRLSVSKADDAPPPPRLSHAPPDPDEIEAYRASFGFSADEIISAPTYVDLTTTDDSFSMAPLVVVTGLKPLKTPANMHTHQQLVTDQAPRRRHAGDVSAPATRNTKPEREDEEEEEEDIFAKMGSSRKYHISNSDAEVDYRRGRSLRERKDFTWHHPN